MEELKNWKTEDVVKFLRDKGLSNVANKFQEKGVTGSRLATMNAGNLEEEFGIDDELRKKLVAELLPRLFPAKAVQKTVFNDSVHGHIEVHPLLVKIINTPQFQRLRNIKQLGAGYFVYPGACHNRFEHSIGTSHLAEKLVKSLQESQPELGITDQDVLCVTIAGLCHDLGHGPFSHLFDNLFIKEVAPEKNWTHEDASVNMFSHLVKSNGLESEFKKYNLHDKDRVFIQKLIKGLDANTENDDTDDGTGRPKKKNFLYEIVANKLTGIDVDKFDYFARDCHNLGIKNSFDHNRYIKMTQVLKVKEGGKERLQICVRNKEAANIYDMFYTRYRLHQQAYQHKTTNIIEIMICEALKKADPHLRIQYKTKDENGLPKLIAKKMSEAIDDMEAYMKLTDNVYYQILYSTEDNLEEARKLIEDIEKRKIYQCIGQTILVGQHSEDNDVILNQMLPGMDHDLFIVDRLKFDYGKKKHYDNLRFYSKDKQTPPEDISKDKVSQFLPESFEEKQIRVYCKSDDKKIKDEAKQAFKQWCVNSNVAGHPQQ